MKKIVFILPSLKAGGAERVISFVAQNIDVSKYNVTLLVVGFEKDSVYDTGGVKTIFLNKQRLIRSIPLLIKQIIKIKPNIVVSSIGHINIFAGFLSMFFKKTYFIGREASVTSVMSTFSNSNSSLYSFLMKLFYSKLSKIICQSKDMFNDFNKVLNIDSQKLVVINNPITIEPALKKKRINISSVVQFITIGRMSGEKGYERILEGLASISSYDFHYTIIGDGPLKNSLLELAGKHNLLSKITHIPYTSSVLEKLIQMDVFLQGSYVEGFPNAVLESCTVGTPVVAFNAPGGTREIIENGITGFIIENEGGFASLLNNKELLTSLNPEIVSQHVFDKFNSRKIITQYEMLFDSF